MGDHVRDLLVTHSLPLSIPKSPIPERQSLHQATKNQLLGPDGMGYGHFGQGDAASGAVWSMAQHPLPCAGGEGFDNNICVETEAPCAQVPDLQCNLGDDGPSDSECQQALVPASKAPRGP